MRCILGIAAQALHALQTCSNVQELGRIEIKPIDRGRFEVRLKVGHSGDRRSIVNRQLFHHFRRFTLLHGERGNIGNGVKLGR